MKLAVERTKYMTAVILYGTIGIFLRYVQFPSEVVALCRGTIGAAFILLYLKVRRQKLDWAAIRENRFWLVLSGVCLGLNWVFLFAAYIHTTVAVASLCNYMAPIVVIIIAPVVLHERADPRKIPCIIAALVGIVLVSGVLGGENVNLSGVLMGLAAALGFVCVVICNRKIHDIPALDKAAVQLAVSAVTILPYVWVKNYGVPMQADQRSVLIVLLLGMLHTGVCYCLYFSGMGSLPVQTVAILGYLEPVVSVLCSALFLHEAMSPSGWIGAVLILAAAMVSEIIPSRVSADAEALERY